MTALTESGGPDPGGARGARRAFQRGPGGPQKRKKEKKREKKKEGRKEKRREKRKKEERNEKNKEKGGKAADQS